MNMELLSDLAQRAGWTLVHSLWQFALVTAMLIGGLRLLRTRSPHLRYSLMLVAMIMMLVAPAITFLFVSPETPTELTKLATKGSESLYLDEAAKVVDMRLATDVLPVEGGGAEALKHRSTETTEKGRTSVELCALCVSVLKDFIYPWINVILAGWLVGMLLLSIRPLLGWRATRVLRVRGRTTVSESITTITQRVAGRLGVQRVVEVAQSTLVDVPTVIGWLKPLVLLPASAVSGLSTEQLEAIIAHELAHVRRHDYLVNLFQLAMETVFFYHPAVWWLSHRMRIEREECCDDIAVRMTGDRIGYAKLLVWLEESRSQSTTGTLAMSASGGSLLNRVRRIVGTPADNTGVGLPVVACALVLALAIGGLFVIGTRASMAQDGNASANLAAPSEEQIAQWISRATELKEWTRVRELSRMLAEDGKFDEAFDLLEQPPLGETKEGFFSPSAYYFGLKEIGRVAVQSNHLDIAKHVLNQLTDPDNKATKVKRDSQDLTSWRQAQRELRVAILVHEVQRGELDSALAFLLAQPGGVQVSLVEGVAWELAGDADSDRCDAFWQRLTDLDHRKVFERKLAHGYYRLSQPEKIWQLADKIANSRPDDVEAEMRTRMTAMGCFARVSPAGFDERLAAYRDKISSLAEAEQTPYWKSLAQNAVKLGRHELSAELSTKIPLLILPPFSSWDLSETDRHPVLLSITKLQEQKQFDEALALIEGVEDASVQLAALDRLAGAIAAGGVETEQIETYSKIVDQLTRAYIAFSADHDEAAVRDVSGDLPEMLNLHLRRVAEPKLPADEVPYLNSNSRTLIVQNTQLWLERGEVTKVVELAEQQLSGNLGMAKWIAGELAQAGEKDAFERLRPQVNEALAKSDQKNKNPLWDYRRFLAQSAYSAYKAGQRDTCFDIFLKLDRNWMSPSFVSRVAAQAMSGGDIEFLHRMESSPSPLMREAALQSLAMHHVIQGDVEEAKRYAETYRKEFDKDNRPWSIYWSITHYKNVTDPERRLAAIEMALPMLPIDTNDYRSLAVDYAKLLGQLSPAKPLPADWLLKLDAAPKLRLQVELEHQMAVRQPHVVAPFP